MPPRPKLSIVPPAPTERAPDLREAVESSLGSMKWLSDSDEALVALARRLAAEIETTIDRAAELDETYQNARGAPGGTDIYKQLNRLQAFCDVAEIVARLGPQLQAVLRDLGGTPASRKALADAAPVGGRLSKLREAAKT